MPKHNTHSDAVAKSRPRFKSTVRKPLREVSNTGNASSKSTVKNLPVKCFEEHEEDGKQKRPQVRHDDAALDRLLLVHSDLSALIHQVDELVVEALKLTSENGMKEVQTFTDFLSQMHTSLKPWVPRFKKALSIESACEMEQDKEDMSMNNNTSHVVQSPEETKWDSLMSLSPLVSWRANGITESGKHLFLLTPLPRLKAFSMKYQEPFQSDLGIGAPSSIGQQSAILDVVGGENCELQEGVLVKQTPTKVSARPLENECVSPGNLFRRDGCMLLMTPCLKVSPPKSCVLLEPVAEFPRKISHGVHQLPIVTQNPDEFQATESSRFQISKKMHLTYPHLLGIQPGNNYGNRKEVIEDSPNWLRSPPKTCTVMEPPLEENLVARLRSSFSIVESPAIPQEPESTIGLGKRPGENTLKKELWTKFEAASNIGVQFNNAFSRKGFLDMLDEVS